MINKFLLLLPLVLPYGAFAQNVTGTVTGEGEQRPEALPGANVYWLGSSIGAATDVHGRFHHVSNAYACDQSLFPTSGSANPVVLSAIPCSSAKIGDTGLAW